MKKLFAISLFLLTLALVNCKDESTDDPTPAKTLNKSLITDKYWKTATGTPLDHYLRKDGKLCSPDGQMVFGTWMWLNNSDSLEEVDATLGRTVWYVEYCTDTEMKMKLSKSDWKIYTKQ